MKKRGKRIITLIICIFIAFIPGIIGSFFTSSQTQSDWYQDTRPPLTPPNYVFPIVWNILFLLIAVSLFISWTSSKKNQKKKIAIVFGLNLFFNTIWSILYFGLQNPTLAFIDIIALLITIILMIITTWKIKKTASYLLIPYLLWVSFASVLNYLSI